MKNKLVTVFLMLFGLLLTLFLFGCTDLENKEANFECEVKIDSWNEDCVALKGKAHICQIYDSLYSPQNKIPEYCTNDCVNRSNYLASVGEECLIISVQDSRLKFKNGEYPKVYWTQTYELVEEENQTELDNNNLENEITSKECQFDSDCSDLCFGSKIIDNYCDLTNYSCKVAKETDCSLEKEIIVNKEYSKTCSNLTCTLNKTELENDKLDISNTWKEYNNLRQELTKLEAHMDDIMLKQAEGITQELMITTFNSLNIISGNWIKLLEDATVNLIDEGLAALANGDQTQMSKTQTFSWAYNNREKLRIELIKVDAMLNSLQNANQELTNKINSLN